jgi:hypothetical protein
MNKAFVREPDTIEYRCPRCGSIGAPVGRETLQSHLAPEALKRLAESGFFCHDPRCEVAYFDQFARFVERDALKRPVYPKDAEAPLCACFGFTRDQIEHDVREGTVTRCKELLAKAKSSEARCAILAADGRCCAAEVQRYFMKFRAAWQAGGER